VEALRAELGELARAARGLVELHELCGADGLPSNAPAPAVLAALDRGANRGAARPHPAGPGGRPPASVARPASDDRPLGPSREPERRAQATPALAQPAPRAEVAGRDAQRPHADAPSPLEAPSAAPARPAPAPEITLGAGLSSAEKERRLTVLADEVRECRSCVLCEKRKQTVFARGNPAAELCFIGEGPGADEDAQGEPFVGKAGQLLDKMIAAMGMQRDEVYICNIVKCRPPENREPLPPEVSACLPYLTKQLEIVEPKVIVTLGNVPLKALFNVQGIMKLRGTWRLYGGAIPVMPTYHPAYVLRNPTPQVKGDVWNDLKLVMKQLGRAIPQRRA
jgi:DNA polymerase